MKKHKVSLAIGLWVIALLCLLAFLVMAPLWAIAGLGSYATAKTAINLTKREDGL